MMLDATAGNRMMWKNKTPPLTVFMDKKTDLRIPPDVIGVWKYPPFREDVFHCVLFDPPHSVRVGTPDPRFEMYLNYGQFTSKREALVSIHEAQDAFRKIAPRLCFKWCDTRDGPTLWGLYSLFRDWLEVARKTWMTKGTGGSRGNHIG